MQFEDVMLIPELDQECKDDDPRLAHAPVVVNQRLPTLNELNATSSISFLLADVRNIHLNIHISNVDRFIIYRIVSTSDH